MEMLMKKHRVDQKAFDSNFRAGGFNHQINESGRTRKIRSIRNLKEGTSGPERDAADQMLKRMGGPQLPLAKRKSKKSYG
jgi:hypothetical protein|tara:strand:+ start:180 stop:419 length:240 start_codon:yes stop_codon:yes gene_type:complete